MSARARGLTRPIQRLTPLLAGRNPLRRPHDRIERAASPSHRRRPQPVAPPPGRDGDDHARYIAADIDGLHVINIYLPNGNPIGTDKFTYKLAWLDRLRRHLAGF